MPKSETLTLLACQIDIPAMTTVAERDAHLMTSVTKVLANLDTSAKTVDLVVLPELSRTLVVDQNVDAILHCGAYYRDTSFHTWHPFAIARALENQVFFLSLNRAGATYGNSLFCLPWQDESTPPLEFAQTSEEFKIITLDREVQRKARRDYTFLEDRLEDYRIELIAR